MTILCDLAIKYNTDKWIKHTYTPYYYELFKERKNIVKKVLEIGTAEGASLLMWRDFFPNAMIYGAEIDPARVKLMDGQSRITVFKCDQSSEKDLKNIIEHVGNDIDLVIDDGSHQAPHQIFSCKILMPMLQKHVIYVIEDVFPCRPIARALAEYDVEVPELMRTRRKRRDNNLVIVRHKSWLKK